MSQHLHRPADVVSATRLRRRAVLVCITTTAATAAAEPGPSEPHPFNHTSNRAHKP